MHIASPSLLLRIMSNILRNIDKMTVMGEDLEEQLSRTLFLNMFLVGECPRCGSNNTHDCEAQHFEVNPLDPRELIKTGSSCGVAQEVDDITVGHCDDCDYLWCLECGAELSIDSPVCIHWKICEECGKTLEYPEDCIFKEEAEAGELLVNPCLPDCPKLEECPKCAYIVEVYNCPKIRAIMYS
jgi:hypothetical protein